MARRRATLVFNPNAGSWDWEDAIRAFSAFWQHRGWSISFTDTIMAPVPLGTANSFAKELGIPIGSRTRRDWILDTLQALADGDVRRMDLGLCSNGRYWLLWAGMGLDGWIIDHIEPRSRLFKRFGAVGYGLKSFVLLPGFQGVSGTVCVDGQSVEGDFLMVNVSNCRFYAGGEIELNRGAVLDDGLFEIWIFKGRYWLPLLRHIAKLALGRHRRDPDVYLLSGRSVSVETTRPTPFHLDAEPAGTTPFSCEVKQGALRLLTPHGTRPGLFAQPGISLSG
jgi:diacylglycerol kinase family enzyme